jgi:hypothetical protein
MIVDRELLVESNLRGIFPEQSGIHRMEGPDQLMPAPRARAFGPSTSDVMRSTRLCISTAARREKVSSMIRRGSIRRRSDARRGARGCLSFPNPPQR